MDLLPQFLVDAILLGGLYTLMSIGFSLSYGVTRIINFAHGEFIMLGAYAAFWMFKGWGLDPLLAMPLVVAMGFVAGWLLFGGLIQRVLDAPSINQVLLTFAISLVVQHLAVLAWTGDARSTTPSYATAAWDLGHVFIPYGRLIAFGVAIVLVAALIAWLRLSENGRAVRAVAQNRDAAALMGVNVNAMYALSFAISSALGAATGAVVSFILTMTPFMGFTMLVKSVAIVIVGGLGTIGGMAVGAFILAFAEVGISYYVPDGSGWSEGVAFVLIMVILVIRPQGIAGHAGSH